MSIWIDQPEALNAHLASWKDHDCVALDTEFIRERTYYPQLALVQLAVPGEILLVDPLVPGMAEALRPLLANAAITKLMHSASEDLQALLRGCDTVPSPLFDTQVAAAMAGFGAGLSYQKLVEQITGVQLEKGETRSDWLKRPLSEAQLTYAADDVLHLHALHARLTDQLLSLGRLDWLISDTARTVGIAQNDHDDLLPHLSVRSAQSLDPEAQARLCRLLCWRDAEARGSDRPKNWVLDSELAVLLSRRPPEDFHRFNALLDSYPKAPRKSRRELWEKMQMPLTDAERAVALHREINGSDKQRLKQLQEAVASVALTLNLPVGLLCARKHLEALLANNEWPPALQGWRQELLEPALAPLLGIR